MFAQISGQLGEHQVTGVVLIGPVEKKVKEQTLMSRFALKLVVVSPPIDRNRRNFYLNSQGEFGQCHRFACTWRTGECHDRTLTLEHMPITDDHIEILVITGDVSMEIGEFVRTFDEELRLVQEKIRRLLIF